MSRPWFAAVLVVALVASGCYAWRRTDPTTIAPDDGARMQLWTGAGRYTGDWGRAWDDSLEVFVADAPKGCHGCLRRFARQDIDSLRIRGVAPVRIGMAAVGVGILVYLGLFLRSVAVS